MRNFPVVLLFIWIALPLYGQDGEGDLLHNEVGVAITGGNQAAGAGVFYRRHFEKGAIRVWAQSEGSGNLDADQNFIGMYNADVALGYQRHFQAADRWTVYYGPDLIFGYQKVNIEEGEPPVAIDARTLRFGVRPFLGVSFRFRERIKVSAETRLTFFYNRERATQASAPDVEPETTSVSYLEWNTLPAGALMFSFFF
ncbi:hypothetical protein RCC89_05530 [Cytophagaceae bacterium ABcell3]|nr:hypothetical protein RCC89_05530 [Cytophagaceae bacterium ABcell3]